MSDNRDTIQTKLSGCDLTSFHDRVLVRPDPQPEKTAGGIILSDTAKDEITTIFGTVLKYGPLCKYVTVGQRVIWNKYMGIHIEYKGEVLLSIREEELLAAAPTEPKTFTAQA